MEMVYLLNGNTSGGGSGGGGGTTGYPLVKAVVQDGAVGLQDRSVTRIELKTPDAVRICRAHQLPAEDGRYRT